MFMESFLIKVNCIIDAATGKGQSLGPVTFVNKLTC